MPPLHSNRLSTRLETARSSGAAMSTILPCWGVKAGSAAKPAHLAEVEQLPLNYVCTSIWLPAHARFISLGWNKSVERFRGAQKFNSSDNTFADKSWIATYPFSTAGVCPFVHTTCVAKHTDHAPSQLVFLVINSCKRPRPLARIPGGMLRLLSVPTPGVNDWATLILRLYTLTMFSHL